MSQLLFQKIRHFLYSEIRHIVDDHNQERYYLIHKLQVVGLIYWLARIGIISLMYYDENIFPLHDYDVVAAFFWHHKHILNKFFIIIMILFTMTGLVGVKTFYFTRIDTLSFQILYDCIVYNTDQYYQSLVDHRQLEFEHFPNIRFHNYQREFNNNHRYLSLILPEIFQRKAIEIRLRIDSWLQLYRLNREQFKKCNRLRLFPNASLKSRLYVLIFVQLFDAFSFLIHCLVLIILIIGIVLIIPECYRYSLMERCDFWKYTIIIEIIIFIPNLFVLVQCALMLSGLILAPFQLFYNSFIYINKHFTEISANAKYRQRPIGCVEMAKLLFIYREHNQLCYYEIFTNKDAWSNSLYYYALFSVPINVCLICIMISETLPFQTEILLLFIMMIHAISGIIPFLTMAQVSNSCHSIGKHIPQMQLQMCRPQHLRLKLKYDDLYERLTYDTRIAFTFGHLGSITFTGLFDALRSYVATFFLLMGFYKTINDTT